MVFSKIRARFKADSLKRQQRQQKKLDFQKELSSIRRSEKLRSEKQRLRAISDRDAAIIKKSKPVFSGVAPFKFKSKPFKDKKLTKPMTKESTKKQRKNFNKDIEFLKSI